MIKSSSTKLMRLLGLLLSLTLLCFTYACSNDAESVESGTDSGAAAYGVHIDSFTGAQTATYVADSPYTSEYTVHAGHSLILTAKVIDSEGKPVYNSEVTFQFATNDSGATLISANGTIGTKIKTNTDKGGQAIVIYKAGTNSPGYDLQDNVSAICHNSKMAINITRPSSNFQGLSIAVTADQDSLKAGENTIIKAKVTNARGDVIGGQAVTFTLAENNSGATITELSGTTDAEGRATALYTAGEEDAEIDVQDIIQASVSGLSDVIIITRIGSQADADYIDRIDASPSTISVGEMSIITATVRHVGDSGTIADQTITFTIPTNNSGASFINDNNESVSTITIPLQLAFNTFIDVPVTYRAGPTEGQDIIVATLGNGMTQTVIVKVEQ